MTGTGTGMTMRSTDLLPALRELPTSESRQRMSFRDMMTGLVGTDRAMFAAEFTSAVSVGLWAVFGRVNVDDDIARAYATRWRILADDHSLHEKWRTLVDSGEGVGENEWFFNGLKGQLAEFEAQERVEALGYTNVELAPTSNQEGWDISAVDEDGREVLTQVKTGTSLSEGGFRDLMVENPDIDIWAVGTEIYDKAVRAVESVPDMVDRTVIDIGPDYALVGGTTDGLDTLSANMGIDIPDGVVDIIPYAAAIMAGARLIYSVVKTEKEFKAADRTTKNRIQVVQTLTLMSRMGVTTVLTTVGGVGGVAAGSTIPGVGNIVAGFGGSGVGAVMGMYLNKRLKPRMLKLALNITGLTHDDLFYYKNKQRIDDVAQAFQARAGELPAAPGF